MQSLYHYSATDTAPFKFIDVDCVQVFRLYDGHMRRFPGSVEASLARRWG